MRRFAVTALAFLALGLPAGASASPTTDAQHAAVAVAHESAVLLALGSYTNAQPLADAVGGLGFPASSGHAALVQELRTANGAVTRAGAALRADGIILSNDARAATAALANADLASASGGRPVSLGWQHVLAAIDDLLNRNGAASARGPAANPPDPPTIDAALATLTGAPSASATTPTPAAPQSHASHRSTIVLGLVLLVLIGAGVALDLRRRRPASVPTLPITLDELADVGRRLARITAAAQIHRALVREAVGLVPARAGAVVVREGDRLRIAFEGETDVFVADRLADGAIGRVAETGQPVMQVSATEPAIRNLPVALVAVPLIVDGAVSAVLVLIRAPEQPFIAEERDLLAALAPVAASAMLAAERASTALEESLVDPLTSVGNRRKLDRDLALALDDHDSHPVALLMVDLDHFKSINDEHGHAAGDEALRAAAETMLATLRPTDAVYRFGGEEFALVLPAAPLPEAVAIAERVRAAVEARVVRLPGAGALRVTASVGAAIAPLDRGGEAAAALIGEADAALYRAKTGGRNRVEHSEPATPARRR